MMGWGVGLTLFGIFILAAVAFRPGWFSDHYQIIDVFEQLGDTGGTVFYVILGLVFVALGVLVLMGVID